MALEIWIKSAWRDTIIASGGTIQDFADEAFALLMAKRRGKSR